MNAAPSASSERLHRQLAFVREIDSLKGVLRQNLITDQSRRENSAEHSWHLGMMAWCLVEYAFGPVDLARAMQLCLMHDLVEIDAGDTFVYGDEVCDQAEREEHAAERVFGLLPEPQKAALWELWRELERGETVEAQYVRVLDRLQPLLLHEATGGVVWQEHGVRKSQVLARMSEIERHAPQLWPVVQRIIDDAVKRGVLLDE